MRLAWASDLKTCAPSRSLLSKTSQGWFSGFCHDLLQYASNLRTQIRHNQTSYSAILSVTFGDCGPTILGYTRIRFFHWARAVQFLQRFRGERGHPCYRPVSQASAIPANKKEVLISIQSTVVGLVRFKWKVMKYRKGVEMKMFNW